MTAQIVDTSTIAMRVVDEGVGPAVLFCHGFPETAYSWRSQIREVSAAGFRAIAPDMRGYGGTDRPMASDEYTVFHLVGDMVALLDELRVDRALVVGNDWGATVAWHCAQMRPDRFGGVVALGVPLMGRSPECPTSVFPRTEDEQFYTLYFQAPGVAEAEFERDVRQTLRTLLVSASGEPCGHQEAAGRPNPFGMVSHGAGLLDGLSEDEALPSWLSESDLDEYSKAFEGSGFRGGLNYYRNLDRNWQLTSSLSGRLVDVPALFMAGEFDPGLLIPGMPDIIAAMPQLAPRIGPPLWVEGAGHWLPQEAPERVGSEIVSFARRVFFGD